MHQVRLGLRSLKGIVCCHTALPPKGCPQEKVMLTEVTNALTTPTPKSTDTETTDTSLLLSIQLLQARYKEEALELWTQAFRHTHSQAPYHHPLQSLLMELSSAKRASSSEATFCLAMRTSVGMRSQEL